MYNSTESTPCQTTTSNSFGEFTFNNLLDDSYYIEIDSPGYLYYKTEPIQIKNGENIVLNSISLKFGDFNKDRQIDIMDLTSIENNYSASVDETNSVYDANDDSKINQIDRNELIQNYGNIPVVQNLEYTKYYSIELYVNSPTSIPILELKQEVVPLELLEEPENANSEFTFVGWSKTENSTVIDFELGDSYNEDNSIKLYAVWEDTTAPTAPIFQIVSGTVGSNGWYKSNVVVKINSGTDNGSQVQKVQYSLSGATTKSLTDIASGSITTCNSQGIYTATVKAYTAGTVDWTNLADHTSLDELTPAGTVITNNDGTYSLELEQGSYDILIDKHGYLDHVYTNVTITKNTDFALDEKQLTPGDINKDGLVELEDMVIFYNNYDITSENESYDIGLDYTEDGTIELEDMVIFYQNYDSQKEIINKKL